MGRIQRLAILACGVALGFVAPTARAQGVAPKYTNAEVVKVRTQERLLVIKNNDGVEQTLELDDHVAGISELRPGDHVILTVREEPGRARVESFTKAEPAAARPKASTAGARSTAPGAVVDENGGEIRAGDALDVRVATLSQQAVRVDGLWSSFRTSCNVLLRSGAAYEGSRPWLSLWDGQAQVDLSSGNCRDLYNQIVSLGQAVNEGMADAEDAAKRMLSPGRIREIERRYSLEWGGWGRGAPELRDHR
jgi:hypothetical protein